MGLEERGEKGSREPHVDKPDSTGQGNSVTSEGVRSRHRLAPSMVTGLECQAQEHPAGLCPPREALRK